MKKHGVCALLLCAALAFGAQGVLAQGATYVFPYEGFRYTQADDETVLTQTNLGEHAALLESLGTTADAVLASYMAAGIVMEVIPDAGGQIAVSVADAGGLAAAQEMGEMSAEQLDALRARFEESGLYETCALTQTEPVCVRMTASAMYGSMPVYTLRYATVHLGRLCMLTQTVVGRVPSSEDDARMERVLAGISFLSTATEPTPSPTPTPVPTPEPTPVPTPGVAEVIASEGEMQVEGVPAFTNEAVLDITGTTDPSAGVTVRVGEKTLATVTAKKDGTFSARVTLPEEGDLVLAVMTDTAGQMLSVRYEKPAAALVITGPEETTFTGESVVVRGETEANATVYVEAEGFSTNVKANAKGAFSVRLTFKNPGTISYTLRVKADGFRETTQPITLTREQTEKEWLASFRLKMIEPDYDDLAANVTRYTGKQFILRGKVMEFTDYDGTPCALVCTGNPGKGVWTEPVWVILGDETEFAVEDIVTFYLVCEGLTLPADGAYYKDGIATAEAPVTRMVHWTAGK